MIKSVSFDCINRTKVCKGEVISINGDVKINGEYIITDVDNEDSFVLTVKAQEVYKCPICGYYESFVGTNDKPFYQQIIEAHKDWYFIKGKLVCPSCYKNKQEVTNGFR